MSAAESAVHVENGWALYAHPFFVSRLDELTVEIERAAVSDPDGFHHHPAYKLFDAVTVNILHNVPADPTRPCYRQGKTLGREFLHWFRVKKTGHVAAISLVLPVQVRCAQDYYLCLAE
ncbi:type II toxin-antitoxin system YhaV family toxin [Pseudomonas sp. Xaverov 259]|uniref:type II toxin-antitoxin system YhaV family toxin n=1 Tax=Pseudomonas sp. Xaverov 259 TaxID=2666086 RepID=UPI0034D792AE